MLRFRVSPGRRGPGACGRSGRARRRLFPQADRLEGRRLLTISLADGYNISSYAGVGFSLNPVTQITGSFDGQPDDRPSDYTVQIDWGDGGSQDTSASLVSGGISGSDGFVLVKASHIYKQPGTYEVTVTATGPESESASAMTATATVAPMPDAASQPISVPTAYSGAQPLAYEDLSLGDGYNISSYAGVGFSLNPVTQITSSYNGQADDTVSDYKAQINWGDATTWDTSTQLVSGGTSGSDGFVLVKGSHIYKQQGTYDITVYVTGPDGQTISHDTATATVSPMPDAASQPISVPTAYQGAQPLAYEDLSLGDGYNISSYAGVGFSLNPVTQITSSYNGQADDTVSDYKAQINWGDATTWDTSTQLVSGGTSGSDGFVLVKGSHIYKQQGTYDITVYVTGPDGQTISDDTATATVSPMPDAASQPISVPTAYQGAQPLAYEDLSLGDGYNISSYAGVGFGLNPVTQITSSYNGQADDNVSDYKAQINWGDSTTWDSNTQFVSGGISGSDGFVLVKGSHMYKQQGTYDITVYVTGPDGQTISDDTATATVSPMPDAASQPISVPTAYQGAQPLAYEDLSLGDGYNISSYAGVGFSLNPVTQITSSYKGQADDTASDYKAQINWGDGTTWDSNTQLVSNGTSGSDGFVLVQGSHIYSQPGTYDVTVYVTGPDGQTISDDTATANVAASYNIGVITPGFEPLNFAPVNSLLGVPAWETQLAGVLTNEGYQDVIQYNWNSGLPNPGGVQNAATTLEQMILTRTDALISADSIPSTTPINLHVIGHSRGVEVDNLALGLLAADPQLPPQLRIGAIDDTMLDPHPANPASDSQESISTNPVSGLIGKFASLVIAGFDRIANDPTLSMPALINSNETFEVYYQNTTANNDSGSQYLGFPGSILNLWGETAGLSGTMIPLTNTVDHTHIAEYYVNLLEQLTPMPNQSSSNDSFSGSAQPGALDGEIEATAPGGPAGLDVIYPQEVYNLTVAQSFVNQIQTIDDEESSGDTAGMFAALLTLEAMLTSGSGTTINPQFASSFESAAQILVNTTEGNPTAATLSASGSNATQTVGTTFSGVVATFSASSTNVISAQYQTTINWGDGQSSAGVVIAGGGGKFAVEGTHTYLAPGTFQVTVAIDDAGGSTATPQGAIQVLPPPVRVASLELETVKVAVHKKKEKETVLELQFSGALSAAAAEDLAAYQLLSGKTKKAVTTFNKPVALSSAQYNPATLTVTLVPVRKLNLEKPERLTINAALLTDAYGRPVGGNFVAIIRKGGISIPAASAGYGNDSRQNGPLAP